MSSSTSGSWDPKRPEGANGNGSAKEESGLRHTGTLVFFPPNAAPAGSNNRTMMGSLRVGDAGPVDFRRLFRTAYDAGIRSICRARGDTGIAAFGVDRFTGELVASMGISGRPGRVLGAVVGRHDQADLRLVEDPFMANRQLAVFVHPLTSWEPDRLRYSVLDLRTYHPMVGERGAELASVVVEGPFMARLGRYVIFVLPTGDASDFPESGDDAWEMLPERVTLHQRAPQPNAAHQHHARNLALDAIAKAKPLPRRRADRHSVITSIGPLMRPDERLKKAEESPVGELIIRTEAARVTYLVGAAALDRGILLGRLPRCDGAGVLSLERISRAHVLVKRVENQVVALDTASTNGTVCLEPAMLSGRVRVVPLGAAVTRLRLADVAEMEWRPL